MDGGLYLWDFHSMIYSWSFLHGFSVFISCCFWQWFSVTVGLCPVHCICTVSIVVLVSVPSMFYWIDCPASCLISKPERSYSEQNASIQFPDELLLSPTSQGSYPPTGRFFLYRKFHIYSDAIKMEDQFLRGKGTRPSYRKRAWNAFFF